MKYNPYKIFKRLFLLTLLWPANAALAVESLEPLPSPLSAGLSAPEIPARSWLLADFESGWIIDGVNIDARIEPASLTKLMTGYLVFEALAQGNISGDDRVHVSKNAWKTGGSRMFIQVNTEVTVEELLRGLIVQSGNDAAVALAEYVGGSVAGFAGQMNRAAAQLGMVGTHFVNSSGLPHPQHYSTARDMTLLTRSLIRRFPDYFRIYSEKEYTYNGITQKNRNRLLWQDPSVDGIKTGYTKNAGYCLIGTARRDGMRLIATVIGSQSAQARADQVQALLGYGYAAYDGLVVYRPDSVVKSLPLWMGQQPRAQVGVSRNLGILYPKGGKARLAGVVNLPDSLDAPLQVGQGVGTFEVKFDDQVVRTTELAVRETYPEGTRWSQLLDWFKRLLFRAGW